MRMATPSTTCRNGPCPMDSARDPAAAAASPTSVDPNRLLAVVAQVAREARPHVDAHVTLDSSLERDLGLDSLARVELVLRIEREFAASLPEQALASSETPRDLLRFVLASAGQAAASADRSVASLVQSAGVRPPEQASTLTEALEYHVERQPDRITVQFFEEHSLSYRALWEGSLAYAARLAEQGLAPGQTVAIMLPTSREYLFSFYGTLLAGGIPVPLYPPARLTTIEDHLTRHVGVLKSAGAALMVTIPEAKPLAWLLRAQVESLRAVLMSPLAFLSRPSQWLRAIHRHRGTISGGPNFSYELCLRRIPDHELEGLDLSSWRFAFNGAEPVSPDTMAQFESRFAPYNFGATVMSPVYGLAEASVGLAFTPPGE